MKITPISTDKRGVVGLDVVKAVMVFVLILGVLAMAILITLEELDGTSVATDATRNITENITAGVSEFFKNAPTFFSLLAIAVIILIIAIVIFAVNKFGQTSA